MIHSVTGHGLEVTILQVFVRNMTFTTFKFQRLKKFFLRHFYPTNIRLGWRDFPN